MPPSQPACRHPAQAPRTVFVVVSASDADAELVLKTAVIPLARQSTANSAESAAWTGANAKPTEHRASPTMDKMYQRTQLRQESISGPARNDQVSGSSRKPTNPAMTATPTPCCDNT
jgi:hypothetical protein